MSSIGASETRTISRNHVEIHEGHFYTVSNTFVGVASDGWARLLLSTGTARFHYNIVIIAESKAFFFLRREPTITGAGTALTAINNRDGAGAPTFTAAINPVLTPGSGTLIVPSPRTGVVEGLLINGGTTPQSVGADFKLADEWIAAPTTNYVLELQNLGTSASDVTIIIAGYEH